MFVAVVAATGLLAGCDERAPEARAPSPEAPAVAPSRSAAEITGWPAGLGRALVLRIGSAQDAYRLVVPELGDRRFADSALSIRSGDSIRVALVGRSGMVGEAMLRIADSESGSGSCVTWPTAEITAPTYTRRSGAAAWRVALERDSVIAVVVDSLMGMRGADSLALVRAVNSAAAGVPALADSLLQGIPFGVRRAYSFTASGVSTVAAEIVRTSSSEADPREERLFVVGERTGGEGNAHWNVFSRSVAGRADSVPVADLLAAIVSSRLRRTILVLSVEDSRGLRLLLLERRAAREWRQSWVSAVSFC